MRTIEEFLEWLGLPENGCEMEALFSRRDILKFINSNEPCRHPKVIHWPAGWYLCGAYESGQVSFCPDCGGELKKEGA